MKKAREHGFVDIRRHLSAWNITHELTVIVFLINLVLGLFLTVQWRFLFIRAMAGTKLSELGILTYSEYVRQGFAQLLLVAVIVYGLLWSIHLVRRKKSGLDALEVNRAALLVFTAVFIASIIRRVYLYTQFHGLSLIRIYGLLFLLWLTFMFTSLSARRFIKKFSLIRAELAITVVFVFILGFFNLEKLVVKFDPPRVNGRVDYVYLSRLSADGVSGWLAAYDYARAELNSRKYLQKSYLDPLDRSQIAYLGDILTRIARHYHDLIHIYGNPTELSAYYAAVLSEFYRELEQYNEILVARQLSGNTESDKARLNRQLSENLQIQAGLVRDINLLKSGSTPGTVSSSFYPAFMPTTFDGKRYYVRLITTALMSFYVYEDQPPAHLIGNWWDRTLLFSYGGYKAWNNLQQHVEISQFLTIQSEFFRLYRKVAAQGPDNLEFTPDISYNTPFL